MNANTKRKLSVDKLSVDSGGIKKSRAEINAKPISAKELKLDGVNIVQTETQKVTFQNGDVQIILTLNPVLELPVTGKEISFGKKTITIDSDLKTIKLDTSGATINVTSSKTTEITIPTAAIPPLELNELEIEDINVTHAVLPSEGFELKGLQLGNLKLDTLSLPQSTVEKLSVKRIRPKNDIIEIDHFQTGPLPLPETLIEFIDATIPKAEWSEGFDFSFGASGYGLKIKGKVSVIISNLNIQLDGLKIKGSIQKVSLNDITIPLTIDNTILKGLAIKSISGHGINL